MTRSIHRRVLSVALFLIFAGCGHSEEHDTALVVSSDPELGAMAAALLPGLAERAGLNLLEPVRVEWRARDELQRYVRHRLDEELPEEEARRVVQSYALLGLVPEDLDLRELFLAVYAEQVAGFYDPDSTALFIMEDQPTAGVEAILLHELVHALQDQHAQLDSLTAKERGNDRRAAAHAAIEGHATLVMLEYMTERLQGSPVDLSSIPDFAETSRPALAAMSDQYPVLAGAPRIIRESLLFPYIEGAGFVHALWRREDGRPAPLGEFLPRSTRHVLEPERSLEEGLLPPLDITIVPPVGSEELFGNDMGRLETEILLEEHGASRAAAVGLRGDRFILVSTDAAPALLWVSVWDDAEARRRFMDALSPTLGRFPFGATIEEIEIDGGSGVLLRAGAGASDPVDARAQPGRP
ncbi:MAG: hypothetical protein WDZ89_03650 [Gemmatimonadota bacterium]